MLKEGRCPKCDSQDVMAGVEVLDWGSNGPQPLQVRVQEPEPPNPGFIYVRGSAYGPMRAWVCAACGFTELYTFNLAALYQSYRKGHP